MTPEPPLTPEPLPHVDGGTGLRRSSIRHPDGEPPNADGCRWCGWCHQDYALWVAGRAFHRWEEPTPAQRAARATAPRAHKPVKRTVCDAMTHDGRGHETFCDIEDPDHDDDHDDGHGTTWAREND